MTLRNLHPDYSDILFAASPGRTGKYFRAVPTVEFHVHGSTDQMRVLWEWVQQNGLTPVTAWMGNTDADGIPGASWHFFASAKDAETMRAHLAELDYRDLGEP